MLDFEEAYLYRMKYLNTVLNKAIYDVTIICYMQFVDEVYN